MLVYQKKRVWSLLLHKIISPKEASKSSFLYYNNGGQKHEGFENACSWAKTCVSPTSLNYAFKWDFFMPQRNFGRHIVIPQSIRPASCLVYISYILWGRDFKFGVWMHLGMAKCRVPFSGHCDLDLWLSFYSNKMSVRPTSCPVHISYTLWGRNSKFDTWMHLRMAECRVPILGHCDLDLDLLPSF